MAKAVKTATLVRFDPSTMAELEKLAERYGESVAAVVRMAVAGSIGFAHFRLAEWLRAAMRSSEIAHVRRLDINLKDRTIYVHRLKGSVSTLVNLDAEEGMSIKMLQLTAGHKSINSTAQYYTHPQAQVEAEKAKLLKRAANRSVAA